MGDGATGATGANGRVGQSSEAGPLTKQERRLRFFLRLFAVLFASETILYLLPALVGGSEQTWGELPFVANSWVKAALLGGLCAIAAADLRRFERLVSLLVAGLSLWVVAGVAILVFGDTSKTVDVAGFDLGMTTVIWLGIALEASLALLFAVLHRSAFRGWHSIEYLSAGQFRTVSALAEALLWTDAPGGAPADPPTDMTPDEVADNADRYLRRFEARRKWVMRVALSALNFYPLTYGRQPLTLMAADERRSFLATRFGDDVARQRIGSIRRWLVQGMVRLGQQVVYLAYYGDPRSWPAVGYVPFSERPESEHAERKPPGGLEVESAAGLAGDVEADVVIVGSGAAGAVVGFRLAEAGHSVVLLERGHHVDPADFTEDEIEMLGSLYRDGALQMTRDFRLQVLQGMCVGGTTVINNAVSLDPPPEILDRWETLLDGRFDRERLARGIASIRELVQIQRQPDKILQPGASRFTDGVEALGLDRDARRYASVEANIRDCLGCGYCNIGCAYGRKLSMLDTLLPWGQQRFGADRLRILSEATAEGIETDGETVTAVHCSSNGNRFRARGRRFVVAAGAINSSVLLGSSGLGGPEVGHRLSFNLGSPITADFDEEIRSYAGLQITHVFEPGPGGPEVIMETWFNPALSQAVAMPGWFEDHRHNMRRYAYMAATGVLVDTEPSARIGRSVFGGPDIVYRPSDADLARLVEGLKLAGRIHFAADAKRVMPATFAYHSFTEPDQLERLSDIVRTNEDIQLGTGHPQGGNSLGIKPETGPVDPRDFRVHGTANLHVCDASVFPTSIRVNPQLTVMGLAEGAAGEVAAAL
ncbi:MAG: GMC family oxidoreductase N-terminal domain-containing protein [Solirubrobacterales bacterium]